MWTTSPLGPAKGPTSRKEREKWGTLAICHLILELLFEPRERGLKLPLLPRAFVGGEKLRALGRGLLFGCSIGCARGDWVELALRFRPETLSRQKAVLDALARHALQFGVGQPVALDGAQVFVGHVGAGNAFVVARNRYGDAVLHVDRQRV